MDHTGIKIIICLFFRLFAAMPGMAGDSQDNDTLLARKYLLERGEVYLTFEAPPGELRRISGIMPVDGYSEGRVIANVNRQEFEAFLNESFDFTVLAPPTGWHRQEHKDILDDYPTYSEYVGIMQDRADQYPDICEYIDAGPTLEERSILFLKITGNKPVSDPKPRFMYTSSMHGDETVGFILMLRLIDFLLENYPTDAQVEMLLDNLEIWINPLANPDGTYFGGDGNSIVSPKRRNAGNSDLNRNFPQPGTSGYSKEGLEPETIIMIDLLESLHFSLSANLHGGAEVMNYPWDYWQRRHPDDRWFEYICREYADTAMYYSPPGYMTFLGGVTNGYDWYSVTGSRQDFVTYHTGGREVTMEISNSKHPSPDSLAQYWEYNRKSLLNYMEQAIYGLRGFVSDTETGAALKAKIELLSHDHDSSHVYTDGSNGWYFRHLAEGNYDLKVSADGFYARTIEMVDVWDRETTRLDISLEPLISRSGSPQRTGDSLILIYPSPARDLVYIRIEIPEPAPVLIDVFDQSGRKIAGVYRGIAVKGITTYYFETINLPPGIYILRFQYGSSLISRNFIVAG